ncbi:MAG: hypothetical protein IKK40_08240, partial [Bacteroidales bacterium]|nr:hypothetical protein [Bacteroidales bacterium]
TFCLQQQKVTKECRRRCILAKNHFTTLNSRGWLSPNKLTPPNREFLTLRSKIFFTLACKVATLSGKSKDYCEISFTIY